jgi:hypothetical protein
MDYSQLYKDRKYRTGLLYQLADSAKAGANFYGGL